MICRVAAPLLLAAAAACVAEGPEPEPAFHEAAIAFLDKLQPRSIADNREYCGFMGLDTRGEFRATDPEPGVSESCEITIFPDEFEVIASYHTHSAYDFDLDSEVPSTDDVLSDAEDRTFGYISTPGGRIWLVDWRQRSARQLCGIGCVTPDPEFVPGVAGEIPQSVTLRDLRRRERG